MSTGGLSPASSFFLLFPTWQQVMWSSYVLTCTLAVWAIAKRRGNTSGARYEQAYLMRTVSGFQEDETTQR